MDELICFKCRYQDDGLLKEIRNVCLKKTGENVRIVSQRFPCPSVQVQSTLQIDGS
jgi:hypothetical protein